MQCCPTDPPLADPDLDLAGLAALFNAPLTIGELRVDVAATKAVLKESFPFFVSAIASSVAASSALAAGTRERACLSAA